MRGLLRDIIPGMFHRRLLLLALILLLLIAALAAKTAHLTTGAAHTASWAELEDRLRQTTLVPTRRGSIFDRKRRLLAEDRPGKELRVHFSVFSGDWAFDRAADAAQRAYGGTVWKSLTLDEKQVAAEPFEEAYLLQISRLWITLAEIAELPPQVVERRQRAVVAQVGKLTANASARARGRRMERLNKDREDVSFTETFTPVAEERQHHPILFDLTPEQLERIYVFADQAKLEDQAYRRALEAAARNEQPTPPDTRSYGIWMTVDVANVNQRSYPWEAQMVVVDRSTLPGALRSDTPLEVTVQGVARHAIGSMRRINREDNQWAERPYRRQASLTEQQIAAGVKPPPPVIDLGGYRAGDRIGRSGVESSMESVLRGTRGRNVRRLDTDTVSAEPTVPGRDVTLTLDVQLQARIQALMGHDSGVGLMVSRAWHKAPNQPRAPKPGDPLNGAAVVMDIDNGEVLAAVSVPGLTLADYTDASRGAFSNHRDAPYRFRPLEGAYDPGSTNKPLIAAGAITDGVLAPDEKLDLTKGKLWEHSDIFRDWIFKVTNGQATFGQMDAVEAVTVSSNVFFGQLAQRWGQSNFGYGRVPWWLSQFGMGRKAGCGVHESAGVLMTPQRLEGLTWQKDDADPESTAAFMTIGEAGMSVTPMQVAAAHATLARGGLYIPPTLVSDASRPGPPRATWRLNLSPAARERALRGMDRSANFKGTDGRDRGTTYLIRPQGDDERVFNCPGVRVWAKSGTAQAAPQREVHQGGAFNGYPISEARPHPVTGATRGVVEREGNHAWVVALVGPEDQATPTHVVAVVVEYGGSGGSVAGPIVNQIIHALRGEGYLGELPPAAAEATAGNGSGRADG